MILQNCTTKVNSSETPALITPVLAVRIFVQTGLFLRVCQKIKERWTVSTKKFTHRLLLRGTFANFRFTLSHCREIYCLILSYIPLWQVVALLKNYCSIGAFSFFPKVHVHILQDEIAQLLGMYYVADVILHLLERHHNSETWCNAECCISKREEFWFNKRLKRRLCWELFFCRTHGCYMSEGRLAGRGQADIIQEEAVLAGAESICRIYKAHLSFAIMRLTVTLVLFVLIFPAILLVSGSFLVLCREPTQK